jgi:sterol desaturase/sphingolipid hydroxylase (fatty acid hydroxylase superfamily)
MDILNTIIQNLHWISIERLAFYAAHFPVYWGLCLVLHLLGFGQLSAEQERKNLVSRKDVALRVLEVQSSQLFSIVALDLLWLLPNKDATFRWVYVIGGLLLFDLVEYVMHRIYHHRLLYKTVHKPHHLLWCPYPFSALYNGKIEYTVTGLEKNTERFINRQFIHKVLCCLWYFVCVAFLWLSLLL